MRFTLMHEPFGFITVLKSDKTVYVRLIAVKVKATTNRTAIKS